MRRLAFLKEPIELDDGMTVHKIMVYGCEEGYYLFLYSSADAVLSRCDELYSDLDDLLSAWGDKTDGNWLDIGDPPEYCQHDSLVPVRIKGRSEGKPQWGCFELLENGTWRPASPDELY